jgi:hypothetical protein
MYLQETGKFLTPLQHSPNHCTSVLSFLSQCRVCRNAWLDTEQRAPKIKWKSNRRYAYRLNF